MDLNGGGRWQDYQKNNYHADATKRHGNKIINAPQATMAGSVSQSMDTSDGDQMDDASLEMNEHALAVTSRPQMTVSSDEVNYLVFRYVLRHLFIILLNHLCLLTIDSFSFHLKISTRVRFCSFCVFVCT